MPECLDYIIIGSGFGGSVSALRLVEKGYRVLVLERGKRFRDDEFATSTWNARKYVWAPALRCFGILQISPFRDVFVLHGAGVGGGSLGYANVLMEPDDALFASPSWKHLADWKSVLRPHYATARRMLGVTPNPRLWPADQLLKDIAAELGTADTWRPTPVGTYFGEPGHEGEEVPDPYFGGEGPPRRGCIHCGGCMVGCRHNAKNTLVKNYLYLAEKYGARILPEAEVRDILPLAAGAADGARYEVAYRRATGFLIKGQQRLRARNVIVAAGALGTLGLLFRCRDVTGSLRQLSPRLGDLVRTNNESLLGVTSRDGTTDYSEGIAITSIVYADPVTTIEPVRYPAGSSLMRLLAGPIIESGGFFGRLGRSILEVIRRPADFVRTHILPGWAQRTTILLAMQTVDTRLRLRLGRSIFTLFRQGLVSEPDPDGTPPVSIEIGRRVTRRFAERTGGIPMGSINEGLFGIPMTAHILGGCPFGRDATEGVVGLDCQVHDYPGLYAIDGSIMPANPGVNPSLTITALAEYAMSLVPQKGRTEGPADRLYIAPMPLALTSPAFEHLGAIPARCTCEGEELSPALAWTGVPTGTRSLAVIVDDPDAPDPAAPKTTWVHWVLYNLPPETSSLDEGVTSHDLPAGTREGMNDGKRTGYSGPCPPIGRHRYFHKLYALDLVLDDLGRPTKARLESAMAGHILDRAELIGTYQKGLGS